MAILSAARQWVLPAALAVCSGIAALAHAGPITEAQVKAALVYNFASFVEWPGSGAATGPLIIGVAGDDAVALALRGYPALPNGRAVDVRTLESAEDPRLCQIVYVALNERATGALLARLRETAVLTVGDNERFTQLGGIIRVFAESDRLRFEVHLGHANAAGLRISSRVLRLASLVIDTQADRP